MILFQMAPKFNDILIVCKFQNTLIDCSDVFAEVMTEEGLCFIFNDLNIENLYTNEYVYMLMYVYHNN